MKFGGTSVKEAAAMTATAEIISARIHQQPLVVLSACGGITDKLLRLAREAGLRHIQESTSLLSEIEEHHKKILTTKTPDNQQAHHDMDVLLAQLREFAEGLSLLGECTPRSLDAIASFGERLSTTIMTHILKANGNRATFFDARTVMRTDDNFVNAAVDRVQLRRLSKDLLLPLYSNNDVVVTQGFIGSTDAGITTTLGRGGSDLSAALFGEALDASEIQIWTDVSGVKSADPRIIPTARTIARMSFAEVRELANYGAKVLHPDTIMPAVERNIPVVVLNTFEPEHAGTVITADIPDGSAAVSAVSARHDATMIRCDIPPDTNATTVLNELMDYCVLAKREVLHCTIGESVCIVVIQGPEPVLYESRVPYTVGQVSLLCVAGPNLRHDAVSLKTVCAELVQYSPAALAIGTSDVSVVAILSPAVVQDALKGIHNIIEQQ